MSGPVPEKTIAWLWGFLWGGTIVVCIILVVWFSRPAHSASFYPACLKPDGDWVHGVSARECRELRGHWYAAKVLKKARKVM